MKKFLNVFFLVFYSLCLFAQPSQSSIVQGLTNWKATVFTLLGTIGSIGMAVMLIRAIIRVASGKHEGYDGIVAWGTALIVWGVGMYILSTT
jgi:hypothetical protein